MNINKKSNGIVTYDAFKSWEEAGRLKDFYTKFSKRPDAAFDEGGRIAACATDDGNVLWVDSNGQVASMDWMSQYDDEPLDENKAVKKNVVKLSEAQLRKVVSESVKKVLNEGYSPDYMELKKNQRFDMTIDSIMGELWDAVEATDGRLRSVLGHRHYNYTSKKQEDAATAVHNIKSILINNRFDHSKIDKDITFN